MNKQPVNLSRWLGRSGPERSSAGFRSQSGCRSAVRRLEHRGFSRRLFSRSSCHSSLAVIRHRQLAHLSGKDLLWSDIYTDKYYVWVMHTFSFVRSISVYHLTHRHPSHKTNACQLLDQRYTLFICLKYVDFHLTDVRNFFIQFIFSFQPVWCLPSSP